MAPTSLHEFVAPTVEALGPLFPTYELEGLIAQGGMGAVYRARQTALDRPVAIKILPCEFGERESFRESFASEARAMARLNHPNLVGVYDFGNVDGMLFIVMELVDGASLHDAAGEDPLDPATVVKLVTAICRGLAHAHDNGVLHRDIKPANILLDEKSVPKIGDFGLARPIGEQAGADEAIYGTPGYAAPELGAGEEVDERSDIYSVGVLMHRLLTGLEPQPSSLPLASSLCGCPAALDRIISKATRDDPKDRFSSAEVMADVLERPINRVGLLPKPTIAPAPAATPVVHSSPRPVSAPVRRVRTDLPVRQMVIALLVIAVAGGAYYFTKNESEERAPRMVSTGNETRVGRVREKPKEVVAVIPRRRDEPVHKGLARLREKLAAGSRDEFPDGTVARSGNHYLVVEKLLSWQEAEEFAEAHGAHLAVLSDPAYRKWFAEHFRLRKPVWVGAGKGAGNQWRWIDDSPWDKSESIVESSESQRHLVYSATAGLFPAQGDKNYGFVLQWHGDGKNPGTVEAQLARLSASSSESVGERPYPLGTYSWNDSHYYYHPVALSWDEARKFAISLGAYLAVPSSKEENEWILQTFSKVLGKDGASWLGGFRLKPGDRWQWLTREQWNNSGWGFKQPGPDPLMNRLALFRDKRSGESHWIAGDGAPGGAQGFLLEWSEAKEPVLVKGFDSKPWLAQVNEKIASRVSPDLDRYDDERKELVQDYIRLMNRIVRKEESEPGWGGRGGDRGPGRGGPWGNRRTVAEIKESLKEAAKGLRLLNGLPEGASQPFREQQEKSAIALKLLDETYDLKLSAHREYYLQGVRKKAEERLANGFLEVGGELAALVSSIEGDNRAFLAQIFAGTPRAEIQWEPQDEDRDLPPSPRGDVDE